jgi:hypothetical protein
MRLGDSIGSWYVACVTIHILLAVPPRLCSAGVPTREFENQLPQLNEGDSLLTRVGTPALQRHPAPAWAKYRTPIRGLYLCDSGAHSGGGVMGARGHNAARF